MIVLDTSVVSELVRASLEPRVLGWMDREAARDLFASAVSEAEIRVGSGLLSDGRRGRVLIAAAVRVQGELFRWAHPVL